MSFPGPYCEALGVTVSGLKTRNIPQLDQQYVTNGVVLEIKSFCDNEKLNRNELINLLSHFIPNLNSVTCPSAVSNKLKRISEQKNKLRKKKKVPGVKDISDLLSKRFLAPVSAVTRTAHAPTLNQDNVFPNKCSLEQDNSIIEESSHEKLDHVIPQLCRPEQLDNVIPNKCRPLQDNSIIEESSHEKLDHVIPQLCRPEQLDNAIPNKCSPIQDNSICVASHEQLDCVIPQLCRPEQLDNQFPLVSGLDKPSSQKEFDNIDPDDKKVLNMLKYQQTVMLRQNKSLKLKIAAKRILLNSLETTIGHYSVRNTNKRDETARKNIHLLRDSQRQVIKLKRSTKLLSDKVKSYRVKVKSMNENLDKLQQYNTEIREHFVSLTEQMELEKSKKVAVQKANSYLKSELLSYKQLKDYAFESAHDECNSEIMKLKMKLDEKQDEIESVGQDLENNKLDQLQHCEIKTKNPDGSFANNIRLCVMELSGLEVAVEKVTPVIQCISNHVFNKQLTKDSLPSSSTVQSIVDEGHYIAKTYIAERVEQSQNWGLCRDGTTRKKQKIVDTSVSLDSGDNMSLGFSRVARETAETIHNNTKCQLMELGKLSRNYTEIEFISKSLEKLSFSMSDRASNEKLANKFLDNWRNETINDVNGNHTAVHHLHCMAHVLLGFHNYITPEIKSLESSLIHDSGPFGRDALPVFRYWSKRESFLNRVVRTTSDVFGPGGDHHGVRDRWEAYCFKKGIKSEIGNYCDNRFNALFQTSAEVYLHKEEFIEVLNTVEKPNLKLQSVKSDLQSTNIIALLQCLGLFYLKVTGPYWKIITSGRVQYFELYKYVNALHSYLQLCSKSPESLINTANHWVDKDTQVICEIINPKRFSDCLFVLKEETRDLLFKSITVVADAMLKTIKKQLVDFLPGGKFYNVPSSTDLDKVKFAPVTNLSCEHHFGDLDSSQRRRPSASLHHHSSVQLLKRNRKPLLKWIREMEEPQKINLFSSARKGGRELRNEHINSEKNVLQIINEDMSSVKSVKRKKTNKNECRKRKKSESENALILLPQLPNNEDIVVGECIVVAYQDNWYPGYVEEIVAKDGNILVKFMAPCRKQGYFQWPVREDRQVVNRQFVLSINIVPDCVNSGRQWLIKDFLKINKLYSDFSAAYFVK